MVSDELYEQLVELLASPRGRELAAKIVAAGTNNQPAARRSLLEQLLTCTSEATGVSVEDMCGTRKYRSISRARQLFGWLARRMTNASYPEISATIGQDHSTVIYGAKRISELLADGDESTVTMVARAKELLRAVQGMPVEPPESMAKDAS